VYFRVDELPPAVKEALARRKRNQADLARYFTVSALREPVQRVGIDEARSQFCAGNYADGMWTHSDANCKDEIVTKTVVGLNDYVTVRVDPFRHSHDLSRGTKVSIHHPRGNDSGLLDDHPLF
jgi:hypothetical protein